MIHPTSVWICHVLLPQKGGNEGPDPNLSSAMELEARLRPAMRIYFSTSAILPLQTVQTGVVPNLSVDFCEKLLSTPLVTPPSLANLEDFLSATPSARVPLFPEFYARLPSDLHDKFIPSSGDLALAFTNSIFPIPFGTTSGSASEHMTVGTFQTGFPPNLYRASTILSLTYLVFLRSC